jgi:hypothetical protein
LEAFILQQDSSVESIFSNSLFEIALVERVNKILAGKNVILTLVDLMFHNVDRILWGHFSPFQIIAFLNGNQ